MTPLCVALIVGAIVSTLPGCVVWEIRDDLRKSNEQLTDVKQALDKANGALDKANADLETANQRLDKVEVGLTRLDKTNAAIDTTNRSLDTLQRQLAALESIDKSLGHLDQHLAAVRKTIGSIDSMIPFMDLGGGPDDTGVATAAPAPPPPGDGGPAADKPLGEQVAIDAATQGPRRDAIEGVWIERAYSKAPGEAHWYLVLLSDGTFYERNEPADEQDIRGKWTRNGGQLRLVPEAPIADRSSTDASGKEVLEEGPPPPEEYKVLLCTNRVLVLEFEESVIVLGRP